MSKFDEEFDVFKHVPDVFSHFPDVSKHVCPFSLEPAEEFDLEDLLVFKSSERWPESWELELAFLNLG